MDTNAPTVPVYFVIENKARHASTNSQFYTEKNLVRGSAGAVLISVSTGDFR
jgi:hypothetical protein